MIRRTLIGLMVGLTLSACGGAFSVPSDSSLGFENRSTDDPRDLPSNVAAREGRRGPNGGTISDRVSEQLEHGVVYRFALGHCGLGSPVDLDGSFWDPIDGTTATEAEFDFASDGEPISATSGLVVVFDDAARFRTASGSIVRFGRHIGERDFPGCE